MEQSREVSVHCCHGSSFVEFGKKCEKRRAKASQGKKFNPLIINKTGEPYFCSSQVITSTLAESIRQTVQTLAFVRSKGIEVKYHGRRKNDPAHYCGGCEEEVFNTIMIMPAEVPHVVHCLQCARKNEPDLKGWMCLEEYHLEDLCKVRKKIKSDPVEITKVASLTQ